MKPITQPGKMNCRRGAMLPMIALTLVLLTIGVVFSVDIAFMHMVRAELRTATDASARAGVETLARTQDQGQAVEAAIRVAALNSVAGVGLELNPSQVALGSVISNEAGRLEFDPGAEQITSIKVTGDRGAASSQGSVSLFFGSLLGRSTFQPTQVATASSTVRDIALILDVSGSMNRSEDGLRRIDALKTAVDVFIDEIQASSPSSAISLTSYSTNAQRVAPLTFDLNSISAEARTFNAEGRTNIFEALRFGSDSLVEDPLTRAFADKTIVLMTDGRFNVGGTPVPSAELAASRGHLIHTVTFSSEANQDIMRTVADIGNGLHLHADDGSDLAAAFREIARALSVTLIE